MTTSFPIAFITPVAISIPSFAQVSGFCHVALAIGIVTNKIPNIAVFQKLI